MLCATTKNLCRRPQRRRIGNHTAEPAATSNHGACAGTPCFPRASCRNHTTAESRWVRCATLFEHKERVCGVLIINPLVTGVAGGQVQHTHARAAGVSPRNPPLTASTTASHVVMAPPKGVCRRPRAISQQLQRRGVGRLLPIHQPGSPTHTHKRRKSPVVPIKCPPERRLYFRVKRDEKTTVDFTCWFSCTKNKQQQENMCSHLVVVTHLFALLVDDCSPLPFSSDAHTPVDRFTSASPSPVRGRRLSFHRGGGGHGCVFFCSVTGRFDSIDRSITKNERDAKTRGQKNCQENTERFVCRRHVEVCHDH